MGIFSAALGEVIAVQDPDAGSGSVREELWVCSWPCRYVEKKRALLLLQCTGRVRRLPGGLAYSLQLRVVPVAVLFLDQEGGWAALAREFTPDRIEELLCDETRWAQHA